MLNRVCKGSEKLVTKQGFKDNLHFLFLLLCPLVDNHLLLVDVAEVDVVDDSLAECVAYALRVGCKTAYHVLNLGDARLVGSSVAKLLVVGEGGLEIFVGRLAVVVEKIAVAHTIERVGLLVVVAYVERPLVVRDGLLVLLEIKMALGVDVVVDGALVGCEGLELRDERIEVFAGFFVVPVVIVTYGDEGAESWVEFVATVELVEKQERFVEFSALEVFDGFSEHFLVVMLRRSQ